MPRTPPNQWGALFNFAGDGVLHMELFALILALMPGQTFLEWFASQLLLRGTLAARPAATTVPIGTEYFATDTGARTKSDGTNWNSDSAAASTLPTARLTNTTVTTLTTAVDTVLSFDTEIWDVGDMHSPSTNPSRLTAPSTGIYLVMGNLSYAPNATGTRRASIRKNGTEVLGRVRENGFATDILNQQVATLVSLNATDYVELMAFQNSGGNLDCQVNATWSPIFEIHRLS